MEFVEHLLVAAHLLGMAAIVGGWFALRAGASTLSPLVWGARAQLVTGIILVGIEEMAGDDVNHAKVGVKLLVAIGVAAAAEIANARSRRGGSPAQLTDAAGALAVLNVLVATLWK